MEEVLQVQWSKADGDPCSLIELHQCIEYPEDIPLQRWKNLYPTSLSKFNFIQCQILNRSMYLICKPEVKKMPSFLKEGDQLLQIGNYNLGSFSYWTLWAKPWTDPHFDFIKNTIKEELEKNNVVTLLIRRRSYDTLEKYITHNEVAGQ
ncbi:uncharacterized protein LOC136027639 [Artemia franciscana]|uniref:uncharacterized protein LOC136027639 n=1 Tax=Artemia franciscana TaxID=6661 RepID=UPI0032DA498E